jgi:hypothetical protein
MSAPPPRLSRENARPATRNSVRQRRTRCHPFQIQNGYTPLELEVAKNEVVRGVFFSQSLLKAQRHKNEKLLASAGEYES